MFAKYLSLHYLSLSLIVGQLLGIQEYLPVSREALVAHLYTSGICKFGIFTLKSDAVSPIYIDLRRVIAYPNLLLDLACAVIQVMGETKTDLICGVPMGAIPLATAVSLLQKRPMIFHRSIGKNHGTKNIIEGDWQPGQSVTLIEDVVTSGESILASIAVLEKALLQVDLIIVLVDREQGGLERLKQLGYNVRSIFTLSELISCASASKG